MATKKKIEKLDEFHWHEAADRTNMITSMMQDFLLDHPVFTQDQSLREKIKQAQSLLFKAYQEIGNKE